MNHFKNILSKLMGKAQDIKIPKKEFVKEHKRLIDVLESPSHKDDLAEAKEQRKELRQELGKTEIQLSVYDNGDMDLESGMDVPQEVFNEIAFELSKNFNLLDLEILEKKKKAFQFKSKHKSKKGGLTESGRKAYNKATGSNLKRPQPGGGKRKKSFCARSKGQMKMHGISCKKDPKKRVCLARKRWACKSESEVYFETLLKSKKKIQKFNNCFQSLKKAARTLAVQVDPEKMQAESEQAEKRFQSIQGLKQQNVNDKINLINSTEPQKKLVEGISWNKFVPYIGDSEAAKQKLTIGSTVNNQGQKVFIKENHPHPFLEDVNLPSAQREVLFHDLSHYFGTQNYVPTTSLMYDGKKLYSVQQFLDNYEHSKHSKQKISDFVPEKDLQKLALADAILANGDRHRNNFLIETEKPGKALGELKPKTIKLIDNGFAFDYPKKRKTGQIDHKKYFSTLVPASTTPGEQGRKMPRYLNNENLSKPLPEDLKKWILDLYSNKESALKLFKKHGASNETINHFQNRLKHAVKLSQRNLPLGNILFSIDKMGV